MTPDELICTTCEGREAVIYQGNFPTLALTDHNQRVVSSWYAHCLSLYGVRQTWQVDACPECGRGGEVGRL